MNIDYETAAQFGGEAGIAARVAAFRQALADHAVSVNKPMPREAVLIENLVRYYAAGYTVEAPPPPPPPPPPPGRRMVTKSTIITRLNDVGKLAAASQALNANLFTRERWYAPDKPAIYFDDPEALQLLKAIGADPAVIMAEDTQA